MDFLLFILFFAQCGASYMPTPSPDQPIVQTGMGLSPVGMPCRPTDYPDLPKCPRGYHNQTTWGHPTGNRQWIGGGNKYRHQCYVMTVCEKNTSYFLVGLCMIFIIYLSLMIFLLRTDNYVSKTSVMTRSQFMPILRMVILLIVIITITIDMITYIYDFFF